MTTTSTTYAAELLNVAPVCWEGVTTWTEANPVELMRYHPDRGYLSAEAEQRYVAALMAEAEPMWCMVTTITADNVSGPIRVIDAYVSQEAAQRAVSRGAKAGEWGLGSGYGPGEHPDRHETTWGRGAAGRR